MDLSWEAFILGVCIMIAASMIDINVIVNVDGEAKYENSQAADTQSP